MQKRFVVHVEMFLNDRDNMTFANSQKFNPNEILLFTEKVLVHAKMKTIQSKINP